MNTGSKRIATAAIRLQIAILAAGFSRRLGRPKALARIRGLCLLRRTLAAASGVAGAKVMVIVPPRYVRYRTEAGGFNAAFAINPRRGDGLSSSVRRSIVRARYSAALLLLPVDLVALQTRDLDALVSRWRGSPRRVVARRIAQHGARPQAGVPLILPRWLYARARDVTGDAGLRDLVARLPAEHRVLVDLPSASFDIDTPADLQAARRRFRPTRFT
jgi:molybdenum cofactor cytidylyltransferase